jgi:pyruvate,water dikinase
VSLGRARGFAAVATSPEQLARVPAGTVLVVPDARAAWTSAFSRVAAVVTETGGALTALSRIAREYRLPALAAVVGATAAIRSGDLVEVDAARGTITRLTTGHAEAGSVRGAVTTSVPS